MAKKPISFTLKTSGSTGKPKEIILLEQHVKNSALRTLKSLKIHSGTVLNCLSTEHVGGFMQVQRSKYGELKLINLTPSKNPFKDKKIPWQEIALLSLVPYQLDHLLDLYPKELALCKNILLGGAPLSKKLKNKISLMGLTNCYETYGMTETLSHIALKKTNFETEFTALEGITLDTDERDCLIINDTKLDIEGLVTNDIVKITSSNSFIWLGRADHVINSGGLKHLVEELENKIEQLPINHRIMVFSRKDEKLGETIHLAIESEDEISTFTKKIFYSKLLSNYEIPKTVVFLPQFIESKTQKIMRNETKKLALDYKEIPVN